MVTKTNPAAVRPATGVRNPVGSSALNDPKHNGNSVDRQESASLAGGRQ